MHALHETNEVRCVVFFPSRGVVVCIERQDPACYGWRLKHVMNASLVVWSGNPLGREVGAVLSEGGRYLL